MTTSSGHTSAILASKVKGTAVYNGQGERIGTVEDIVLDKQSNQIMFAALGFGGFLGMGEKYHPVPWSMLDYDKEKGGYVVPMNKDVLQNAPAYELADLTKHDGSLGGVREKSLRLLQYRARLAVGTSLTPPRLRCVQPRRRRRRLQGTFDSSLNSHHLV